MITIFLLLIFLFAALLFWFKKPKPAGIFLTIFAVIFILQGSGSIANFLLDKLQKPYTSNQNLTWKRNNIIILLGSGTIKDSDQNIKPGIFAYSRILKTAELYFSCKKTGRKCSIIISGGDVFEVGVSEAENYRDKLLAIGVRTNDIITETDSKNTYQNAKFVAEILKEKKYDQLVLVTSGFHLKRSLLYFSNFDLTLQPAIADYLTSYHSLTGYNSALTDMAVHEYVGIGRFYFYNLMGWNKK